jgi:hypothetical protein
MKILSPVSPASTVIAIIPVTISTLLKLPGSNCPVIHLRAYLALHPVIIHNRFIAPFKWVAPFLLTRIHLPLTIPVNDWAIILR